MNLTEIKIETNMDLSGDFDFMHSEHRNACDRLINKRDVAIIEHLKSMGYKLANYEEISYFFRTKCAIHFNRNISVLYVDDLPVLKWNNSFTTKYEDDKIIITLG